MPRSTSKVKTVQNFAQTVDTSIDVAFNPRSEISSSSDPDAATFIVIDLY